MQPATIQAPQWISAQSLELPSTDIVSFAFDRIETYDSSRPIFIDAQDPSKFVTASTVLDTVQGLCKGLKEAGLKPGDCVTICSCNNILYPCLWLGIIAAGGVVAGVNPALTLPELEHHLNITKTKYLITHERHRNSIAQVASVFPVNTAYVFDDDLLNCCDLETGPSSIGQKHFTHGGGKHHEFQYTHLSSLLAYGRQSWHSINQRAEMSCTPALHATTSGTTGLPKAAVIPHQYLVSQSVMLEDQYKLRVGKISQLICLPIFHSFAGNAAFVLPLRCGITTYFLPRFRIDEFADAVHRFQITDTLVVPPIISSLVQHGNKLGNRLYSLQRMICAGAPMNTEVQRTLYQHLAPKCRVSQCWGTTETGWVTLTPTAELDNSGSVGQLTANVRLKLLASDGGMVLEDGQRGEALIKSDSLFNGYLNNSAANASAFDSEGFYRTGDRAYYKNGKVFIEGRMKDILKVKGWQVSPEELEEAIRACPGVVDCAVVGLISKDPAGLEQTLPCAYVVVGDHHEIDAAEICSWVASRTVSYKHLTGGVFFVDSIPRNASGKILRRVLVESCSKNSDCGNGA